MKVLLFEFQEGECRENPENNVPFKVVDSTAFYGSESLFKFHLNVVGPISVGFQVSKGKLFRHYGKGVFEFDPECQGKKGKFKMLGLL